MPALAMTAVRTAGSSNRLALAVKVGVSALVAAWVISRVDPHAVAHAIAVASPPSLVLALVSFLVIPLLGGLRWWCVLRGIGEAARPGALVPAFSVAMVLGQVLPSLVGDGFRVLLATQCGYRPQPAIHSVLIERGCMLLTLLGLVVVSQPLLAQRFGLIGPMWLPWALLFGGVCGLALVMLADRFAPAGAVWRSLRSLAQLCRDARRLLLSPWSIAVLTISVISNLNFVVAATLLGSALDLGLSFPDFLAAMPLVTLATTLPVSLGGWGVREGILTALLGAIGVPVGTALVFSLMFGAGGAVSGLPGLFVWWLQRDAASGMPSRGVR